MVAQAYANGKALARAAHTSLDDVIDPADTRRWILAGLMALPTRSGAHGEEAALDRQLVIGGPTVGPGAIRNERGVILAGLRGNWCAGGRRRPPRGAGRPALACLAVAHLPWADVPGGGSGGGSGGRLPLRRPRLTYPS